MEPSAYQPTAAQHPLLGLARVLTTAAVSPCSLPFTAPPVHNDPHYGVAALGEDVHKYAGLSLHTPPVPRYPAPLFPFSPAATARGMR